MEGDGAWEDQVNWVRFLTTTYPHNNHRQGTNEGGPESLSRAAGVTGSQQGGDFSSPRSR